MKQTKHHSPKTEAVSKSIRLLCLLLAMTLLLVCILACKKEKQPTNKEFTNEQLIENRIATFVTAYNDGDMDTVLSCLDAKTRTAFQAMLNLLGGLAGSATGFDIDLADLFSLGVSTTSGDFMGLKIINIAIIDSANATATTTMNLTGARTLTIYFEMVYENNGWYIHDMNDENKSAPAPEKGELNIDEILANVDSSFLGEQSASQGLQYTLSEDQTHYILTGLGECEDSHIVLPEFPVDYNPVPLKEIRASFFNIDYITIPASVIKISSVGWSYSYTDLIALNYLGTIDQWCAMEFSGASASPCADNAILYVNGVPVVGTLEIPETTKSINSFAFYQYDKISKVEISKNVESIAEKSFYGCENLENLIFRNASTVAIFADAFGHCAKIKNLDFGNNTRSIGEFSFANCASLEEVSLGDGIEEIGNNAFLNCTNLKSIRKGNSATNISETAFANTAFYNNNSNWESGMLYVGNCLYGVKPDVISADIKNGTRTISNKIFQNHKNLTNVILSDSMECIAEGMFQNCKSLKSITFSNSLKWIEENAFRGCSELAEINLPDSVERIGLYAFHDCPALKSITLGKGIKTIENCFQRSTETKTIKYNGTLDEWKEIDNYHAERYADGERMCGYLIYSAQTGIPLDVFCYAGHYYRLLQRSAGTWEDAKTDCEALGGHLVTITSAEENAALREYMICGLNFKAYIGLSDAEEEGVWKWVTGESVNYTNFDTDYSDEPNGSRDQNYVMIGSNYPEGYWSDENGRGIDDYWNGFFYICEWEFI